MNRFVITCCIASALFSCSKMDEKPGAANDSLLSRPMNPAVVPEAQPRDTATGLLVDQARFRTPVHEAMLQRFGPEEVVNIYHGFKAIRKPGISQSQLDSFERAKKISLDELKAILEEGDRLGWSNR